MAMRTIDVRGRKVEIHEAGEGRPLVYLHGFADLHSVTAAPLTFHDALAGVGRLLAPALPGVGASDELPAGSGIHDVVFHCLETLDALGVETFDLVGHCVGGWVAAELAVLVPERIGKLALIGASGLFVAGAPIADVFMHAQPERGVDFKTLREVLFAGRDAAQALRFYPDGRGDTEEEVRRYQMLRLASFIGFKPPYFYDRPLIDRLHRARMPAAVIWGENDRFVPRSHGEAYARGLVGSGGRVHVVQGSGHSAPIECGEVTAGMISSLVTGRPGRQK
jgi:pimeloyl-ACP methyl ester carboxylesterase